MRHDPVGKARHAGKAGEPDSRLRETQLLEPRDEALTEGTPAGADVAHPVLLRAPFLRRHVGDGDGRDLPFAREDGPDLERKPAEAGEIAAIGREMVVVSRVRRRHDHVDAALRHQRTNALPAPIALGL